MSVNEKVVFRSKMKESAVDHVLNEIQTQLLLGNLRPGDKLPNEDELALSLGVSRGSVRNAMKVFSACGIMRIQAGDGTYVCSSLNPSCLNPMLFSLLVLNPDSNALADFRERIEYDIVELIIGASSNIPNVIAALDENIRELNALKNLSSNIDDFVQNDIAFHHILSSSCHNIVFETVYNNILDYFRPSIKKSHLNQHEGSVSSITHEKITDAIRQADLTLAQEAIHDSIKYWKSLNDLL